LKIMADVEALHDAVNGVAIGRGSQRQRFLAASL
jgi:hypothetical protein